MYLLLTACMLSKYIHNITIITLILRNVSIFYQFLLKFLLIPVDSCGFCRILAEYLEE